MPIVVHHSDAGWTGSVELSDILDLEPRLRDELGVHVPRLSFILDDLSSQSDEALQSRAMTALARSVLWALRDSRRPGEILRRFERWAAVMRTAMEAPNGVRALAVVLRYISEVSNVRADELQRKVLAVLGAKGKDAMTTAADTWREEGRIEGERRLVLRLLAARFGELPPTAVARVNAAQVQELDRWAEQVLVATTLESVLGSS